MPRLIWVFGGHTATLLVLSCRSSCNITFIDVTGVLYYVALNQNWNAVFIWSVDMCFIFIEQINVIFMQPLYAAVILCHCIIRTASSEFGTYRVCEQRRFRRACASAQSRQNLCCSLIQAMSQEEPSDRKPDPWPLWMAGHAQLKFLMTECSKTQIRLTRPIKCIKSTDWILPTWKFSFFTKWTMTNQLSICN